MPEDKSTHERINFDLDIQWFHVQRKSSIGRPELLLVQMEEADMKQIDDLVLEYQHGQTTSIL
jgi:hypothetical protein